MPIDLPLYPDGVPMDDVAASLNKDLANMEPSAQPAERPITVAEIVPYLSERGTVEVESAIKSFRLQVAAEQLAEVQRQVAALTAEATAKASTDESPPDPELET